MFRWNCLSHSHSALQTVIGLTALLSSFGMGTQAARASQDTQIDAQDIPKETAPTDAESAMQESAPAPATVSKRVDQALNNTDPSEPTSVTTQQDLVKQLTKKETFFYYGPQEPIGHSLSSPEAKKRISYLLADKVKQGVSRSPIHVAENLPPLVDGKYGFEQPSQLNGVPRALIHLGAAGPKFALIVEKLHHRLSIFQAEEGRSKLVRTFRAITGKDPNDKAERGDLRTPEGVYFVVGRLPDHSLPPKYGRLAFTLDYPNVFDRLSKKSGYGIWLHATDDPKRLLKPFDTEGCIAVSNEDISEIQKYITTGVTPIIVTKEMTTAEADELTNPRQAAFKMLESWRTAWKTGSFDNYMAYYSDTFNFKGMNKTAYREFKERLASERNDIDIKLSEPTVVAFENQIVMNFLQEYVSDGHSDFGIKSLYMRWENDQYRIVSEAWRPVQKTETALQDLQLPEGHL